jgi:hydrogenase maturation factor
MHKSYPLGKLPAEHLARLFSRHPLRDERVVLGPGVGHDAAAVAFGDRYVVAKTDPITFATAEIGWYAVHVNANDVACTGATPRWFLATLLLPQASTDEALVDKIFDQIADTCQQMDVTLIGGHTEITHGLNRPIVVGFMLGEVAAEHFVRPEGTRPGDALLLTKGIAVEGTAIIALEKGEALPGLERDLLERSRRFLYEPGISVVRDAGIATSAGEVHAMHDPTEGGLATGLWELAEAADVTIEVDEDALPVYPETRALCERLNLNPLGLIASGALLLTVAPGDADAVEAALKEDGIAATRIGRVTGNGKRVVLRRQAGRRLMPRFERDEIARLFD